MREKDTDTLGLVSCPACGARKGSPCRYMPVAFPSQNRGQVGNPIPNAVHQDRSRRAAKVRRAEARRATILLPPPPTNASARIAQAENRWELEERARLVAWLAVHSVILTGTQDRTSS